MDIAVIVEFRDTLVIVVIPDQVDTQDFQESLDTLHIPDIQDHQVIQDTVVIPVPQDFQDIVAQVDILVLVVFQDTVVIPVPQDIVDIQE